ncbi:AP-2 complex subunit beta-like [Babylonia areolata]|uniref:AP-2 complex subunit beta-like n=1 Tax=Babylonia areolata TaxID=304850 RepID=UPI003FD59AA8
MGRSRSSMYVLLMVAAVFLMAFDKAQGSDNMFEEVWLPADEGKDLEITGTFARRNGQIFMELTFMNKATQPMSGFDIQFSKNSFGLMPATPLQMQSPLLPNSSASTSLQLSTTGQVEKMEPLLMLKVAVNNNIDVFNFSCMVPMHVLFVEEGEMDKRTFMNYWKEIPTTDEVQYVISDVQHKADTVSQKLRKNNVFTILQLKVEGQDMLYQSLKLTNGIDVLAKLQIDPSNSNSNVILSLKGWVLYVFKDVRDAYETILHN